MPDNDKLSIFRGKRGRLEVLEAPASAERVEAASVDEVAGVEVGASSGQAGFHVVQPAPVSRKPRQKAATVRAEAAKPAEAGDKPLEVVPSVAEATVASSPAVRRRG